jgi:hypothetical protein
MDQVGPHVTDDPLADQDVLARLNMRPVFVGVDIDLIRSAIVGEAATVRNRMIDISRADDVARSDRSGGWIVPLGAGHRTVRDI